MWRMLLSKICFGYRYKWTIPVKWHTLKNKTQMITIFAKENGNDQDSLLTLKLFKIIKNIFESKHPFHNIITSHSTHLAAHQLAPAHMWHTDIT